MELLPLEKTKEESGMKKPSYTLHITPEDNISKKKRTYKRSVLEEMTTVQLRDICIREKIIQGILHPLDRRELIEMILRYRGVEEARFIRAECEGGFERVSKVIQTKITTEYQADAEIRTPAHVVLYPEQGLTLWDAYQVGLSESLTEKIGEGNVLLAGADGTLCTVLGLEAKDRNSSVYYLTRSAQIPFHPSRQRGYSLLFFGKQESDYLYQVYYDEPRTAWAALTAYRVSLADVEIRKVTETEEPLTIDFGTSNTAVGMYLGENKRVWQVGEAEEQGNIQLVSFVEDTGKEKRFQRMVPSMVSVEEVKKEQVRYAFGYDARGRLRSRYAEETYSVFYEIKRWIGSYEELQEVTDAQGNSTFIRRKEIIRAYFLFLIHAAEEQFRCRFHRLQFTCPVRVREQFRRMIQEILPEYEMDAALQIDEASAVVYNTIHNLIGKKQYEEGETVPAMILDCGGGTTDLTSCSFRIFNQRVSYQIEIETVYENGDTNFGGNNLTYRILQALKIVLAEYYTGQTIGLESLLAAAEQELYQYIDREGEGRFYKMFDDAYQKAEQVIPTRFREYETGSRREYYLVRNNYYFLFDLAERVKHLLGKHPKTIRFGLEGEAEEGVIPVAHWDIIRLEQGGLKESAQIPPVTLDERQLSLLLAGDIYGLLNQFLENLYQTGELEDYALIKLSGQSCRIGLFREALKEFLPGKSIRFQQTGKEFEEFKLACVKGAILCAQAKKSGMANISISYELPQIPFSVSAYTHEQTEKVLIAALDRVKSHGFLSRHKQIRTLELFLRDERGELRYRYVYENQPEDYKAVTYEQIRERYADSEECILQDDTDTISDNEVKFFVFAAKGQWGFYLVPVMREQTQLYLGTDAFYQFENSLWETDFFDGTR